MKLLERFKYTRIFDYELANCENCENLCKTLQYTFGEFEGFLFPLQNAN